MTALNSDAFVIEGDSLVFMFTLDTAVSTTTSYNWKIVPKGLFPALSGDFATLTGVVNFAIGESEKTITITTNANTSGTVDRNFVLEITDSSNTLVASSEIITLEEDDDSSPPLIEFLGGDESDVLGAATSFEIDRMDGFGGDDYYIITQYQQGDVSISDDAGTNVVKFDYGVEITSFSEMSRFGGAQVTSFTVALKSGAEISVASPKGTLSYQIGDGEVLDYDAFKAAIDAFGTNAGSALAEPFPVETSTPSPDLTSDTESVPLIEILGGDDGDVLGAATSFEISRMSGFGGNDYYIITQYQQGDVSISDDAGMNVIKFDYGVEITGFSEMSRFGGRQVARFTVTLESGAEINIASPKGTLSYQIGDGGVLDYDAFKAAIGASGTNGGSALANSFPVPFPAVIDDHGPVFTSGDSASVNAEDIGEDATIYIAAAADADGDTVSYSITGGNDAGVFGIDASTGVVSLLSGQSLDAEGTSSYTLTITASSQARGEAAKTETLDVDITVTNVNDEAPVVTSGATGDAVAENVVVDTSTVIYTAAGTYDVTPIVWSLKAGNSDDAALFSIDISSGVVTFQSDTTPDFEAKPSYDFTIVATSGSLSAEQDVSIAVTNVDEGSAVFTVTSSGGDINGVVEGNVLTVGVSTSDPDGDGTFTYQWHRDGSDISGANSESYTIVDDDEETSLTVTVSYTDSSGMVESVTTAPVVVPPDNIATGLGLSGQVTQISEDTTTRTRIGEVTFDDADGGDSGTLELAGANAALFELDDTTLYLRAGASLDYETVTTLEVRVQLTEDTSIGVNVPITITNANDVAPVITSGASGLSIDENAEVLSSTVIYTAAADVDITAATWSLKTGNGDDAALFNIDSITGAVMFRDATTPDFEAKSSYAFTVIATSGGLDGVEQVVTVEVNNRNDVRPVITSAAQPNIDERTVFSTNTAFYTAAGTFDVEEIIWSLKDNNGDDADLFDIDTASGVVTFKSATTPDHEVKDSYSFTVIATSGSLEAVEQDVTIDINDINDQNPVITSSARATPIDENTELSSDTVIYTATGTHDVTPITWSFRLFGDHRDFFDIDRTTGEVTFKEAITLDYEGPRIYRFTIVARSGSREASREVIFEVGDIDEDNHYTSDPTGLTIVEGTEISTDTILYIATAVTPTPIDVWWFAGGEHQFFKLKKRPGNTGELTFKEATTPDFETKSSYTVQIEYYIDLIGSFQQTITIAVTNIDEGDAEFDVSSTGNHNEIAVGDVLTAVLVTPDPDGASVYTYQWHRDGVDIAGANDDSYTAVADDVGAVLTVTVNYIDDSNTFETVIDAVNPPYVDDGDASFAITSSGDTAAPAVGDVLTANRETSDPDGDGTFSYQWFLVGGDDIEGATSATYRIIEADQTIGVRVSYTDGEGFNEEVEVELNVASVDPIVDRSAYTLVENGDGSSEDTLAGTSADDLIQGGDQDDTITTGGGDDIVIGGYGRDTITLSNDGAETLVYRFSSDVVTARGQTGWIAIDGADRISNFERGVDKLVLVDVDGTPIDLAEFLAGGGSAFRFATIVDSSDDHVITGVTFQFVGQGLDDGPGGSGDAGRWFSINFKDTITVYEDYSTDMTTTAEGTRLLGLNGEHHDTTDSRSDRWLLTDFSLIPNYFETADEDFADGFQVVTLSDVGVDII